MNIHIGFVEDDDVIRENYSEILTDEGFNVTAFADRHTALQHFKVTLPDIVILDVGLNGERDGGFKLCADLRHLSSRLPIIFLTSRDEEFNRISGIRLGADDYITKDISINYLMVRIEALFYRIETLSKNETGKIKHKLETLDYGFLTIDCSLLSASWKNSPLELSLTQFWILNELVNNPGEIKHYDKLMHAANTCVEPNTITAHIKTIRDRFHQIDSEFDCIKTERGMGYRWVDTHQQQRSNQ